MLWGRHVMLAASRVTGFDAVVDCWGGRVVMGESELTETTRLRRSITRLIFRVQCSVCSVNDDQSPSPEQVASKRRHLKEHGKVVRVPHV